MRRNGPSTAVAALVMATSLSACAPLPWRTLSSSHDDALAVERHDVAPPSATSRAAPNATPANRRDTLDRIWRTVDAKYRDADVARKALPALVPRSTSDLETVGSDVDFYRVLQRNGGAIEDSHTLVITPLEAEQWRTQRSTAIGIEYDIVDGRVVVTSVSPGFPAAEQGVRRGMLIEQIDDQPIDDAFLAAAALRRDEDSPETRDESAPENRSLVAVWSRLGGNDATPGVHRVALRRADESRMQVDLLARAVDVPTVERFDPLPSGVGVLRWSRFDPSVLPRLSDDLARAAEEGRAFVIDLRHDPGGAMDAFIDLVDHFIDRPAASGRVAFRLWELPVAFPIDGEAVDRPYLEPIALLIDGATGSAAGMTAHALAELCDAIVVGVPTSGRVVGLLREFELPDAGVLQVAELGFTSPHGRRMENAPPLPTVPATPTWAQLRAGADVLLRVAEHASLAVERTRGDPR